MWNPFGYKFWLVRDYKNFLKIQRGRTSSCVLWCDELVDGPFNSQEDAVHALHFWELQEQTKKRSLK
jgi:hypothetical protein